MVDNRPGAGGAVGTAVVAKSPADGYTLLVSGSPHAINPVVYAKLPYDSLKDFVEIAPLAALYQALVVSPTAGLKKRNSPKSFSVPMNSKNFGRWSYQATSPRSHSTRVN